MFENWLHPDRPALTLEPFDLMAAAGYRFYFAGWRGAEADCVLPALPKGCGGMAELVLLPFLPAHRFHLPAQLNVLAVPVERQAELARRFGAGL